MPSSAYPKIMGVDSMYRGGGGGVRPAMIVSAGHMVRKEKKDGWIYEYERIKRRIGAEKEKKKNKVPAMRPKSANVEMTQYLNQP